MVYTSGWPRFRQDRFLHNRVIFGLGAAASLGDEPPVRDAGGVLLLCSPRMARSEDGRRVLASIGASRVTLFDGVEEHVRSTAVEAGLRAAQGRGIEAIVSLGGGSTIGLGKALSVRLNGALEDAEMEAVPHVAVPTTYSGSELTPIYGITEVEQKRKRVVHDPRALPTLAVYDPELTFTLPPRVTAGSGLNALAHCVDVLLLSPPDPESRAVALEGIRRIMSSLALCVHSPHNAVARSEMMAGALLGGRSIARAEMGLHHALSQTLGGRGVISHGDANALILPHVVRFNGEAAAAPLMEIAEAMGVAAPAPGGASLAVRVSDFLMAFEWGLGLPGSLREVGVPRDVLASVAEEVFAKPVARRNPRPLEGPESILALLDKAWAGGDS